MRNGFDFIYGGREAFGDNFLEEFKDAFGRNYCINHARFCNMFLLLL